MFSLTFKNHHQVCVYPSLEIVGLGAGFQGQKQQERRKEGR